MKLTPRLVVYATLASATSFLLQVSAVGHIFSSFSPEPKPEPRIEKTVDLTKLASTLQTKYSNPTCVIMKGHMSGPKEYKDCSWELKNSKLTISASSSNLNWSLELGQFTSDHTETFYHFDGAKLKGFSYNPSQVEEYSYRGLCNVRQESIECDVQYSKYSEQRENLRFSIR